MIQVFVCCHILSLLVDSEGLLQQVCFCPMQNQPAFSLFSSFKALHKSFRFTIFPSMLMIKVVPFNHLFIICVETSFQFSGTTPRPDQPNQQEHNGVASCFIKKLRLRIAIIENVISPFLKAKMWKGIHLKIAEFKTETYLFIQTEKKFIFANLTSG